MDPDPSPEVAGSFGVGTGAEASDRVSLLRGGEEALRRSGPGVATFLLGRTQHLR